METEGVDADNGRACIHADARVQEAVSSCDGGEVVALELAGVTQPVGLGAMAGLVALFLEGSAAGIGR